MKKLWNNNRIMVVLLGIIAVCFVTILVVSLSFFYNKNTGTYGSRLKDIDKHQISNKFIKSYKESLTANESIKKVTFKTKGRVIYIHVTFDESVDLTKAQATITESLSKFDEKTLKYYDINFIVKNDNFTNIGAKNAVNDIITWNNNRIIEEENEDEKE